MVNGQLVCGGGQRVDLDDDGGSSEYVPVQDQLPVQVSYDSAGTVIKVEQMQPYWGGSEMTYPVVDVTNLWTNPPSGWNPLDLVDPILKLGFTLAPEADITVDALVGTWGWLVGGGVVQHDRYECSPDIWCYDDHWVPAGGDPDAVTVGNRIFCKEDCSLIVDHELVHTIQYVDEPGFAVRYLIEALFNGACIDNKFEAPAYAIDGSCD